jgi:6-phosphofructokinase
MDQVLKWAGRIIVFGVGVVAIVMGATSHGNAQIMGIIRGIAAIGIAVYATIRGLAGTTTGQDDQIIGLVNPSAWYDWVVVGGLFVVIVITFVV